MSEQKELIGNILKFTSRVNQGKVDVVFDSAVVRLSMTPEQARSFAKVLVLKADVAERAAQS